MKDLISLLQKIIKLYSIFDTKRKYQIFYILIINIFNGFLEYITLFAVSLFLSSLSDPKSIIDNTNFLSIFNLNIKNESEIVFYSTLIFISIILFSSITRIANLWINMKYRTQLITFLEKKSIFKNNRAKL